MEIADLPLNVTEMDKLRKLLDIRELDVKEEKGVDYADCRVVDFNSEAICVELTYGNDRLCENLYVSRETLDWETESA